MANILERFEQLNRESIERYKKYTGGKVVNYTTQPEPVPADGPGTRLKQWFEEIGLQPCQRCTALALKMDRNGPEWCRENLTDLAEQMYKNVPHVCQQLAKHFSPLKFAPAVLPKKLVIPALRTIIMQYGIKRFENDQS